MPLFTGQLRDGEAGLDYFQARYFGAVFGRFTSPDPGNAGADPMMPGSWNMYSYGYNNPMVYTDPTGMAGLCGTDPNSETGADRTGCLAELLYESFLRQTFELATNVTVKALEGMSRPRDTGCLASAVGAGSTGGLAAGMMGAAASGGITLPVLAPGGMLVGGTAGYLAGMANCMVGSGGGGGGANSGSQSATPSSRQLLAAGQKQQGGLTEFGRALQKHGNRPGSKYPKPSGSPAAISQQGEDVARTILNKSGSSFQTRHHARFGNILEVKAPRGQGMRFSADGKTFIGFIE